MFNIGEYPGIVPSDDASDKVVGELYKLTNPLRLVKILDEYEEFYPENESESVFLRKDIQVEVDGTTTQLWIFVQSSFGWFGANYFR
jgi:pyruvate carboxylase